MPYAVSATMIRTENANWFEVKLGSSKESASFEKQVQLFETKTLWQFIEETYMFYTDFGIFRIIIKLSYKQGFLIYLWSRK